jgi:glycosyltransferase involved in cell wall biosynthesis
MKILIATGIYPPDIGGPATILEALVYSLKKKGFVVEVITYSDIGQYDDDDTVFRVIKNKFFSRWQYFFKMLQLARWSDVIYVTDVYSVGFFAYLIKKLTGKKYIVRFAGDAAWEMAVANDWTRDYIVDFQTKKYGKRIEHLKARRKKILVNANGVIAVSNFISEIATLIGVDKSKISVIYNSIDFASERINPEEAKAIRDKFNGNSKIIVTACRLMPWKGVGNIIKILPQLKKEVGNVNFLILGVGQELDNLKKLAIDLDVVDNVKFLGKVNHHKVMNYFSAADLFILNTHYEGLSHTLLEAMKSATPIVTTNIGGNPEVIEDNKNGLLIDYNNQEQLLAATIKILSDDDLANKFRANAKEKLKIFNWDNIIDKTTKLIKSLNE